MESCFAQELIALVPLLRTLYCLKQAAQQRHHRDCSFAVGRLFKLSESCEGSSGIAAVEALTQRLDLPKAQLSLPCSICQIKCPEIPVEMGGHQMSHVLSQLGLKSLASMLALHMG